MVSTHPEIAIVPYIRGELNADERERMRRHLQECEQCRKSADSLASVIREVSARLDELPTPEWPAYQAELRRKIAAISKPRSFRQQPRLIWGSIATASVAIAALLLSLVFRPWAGTTSAPMDQLALEQQMDTPEVGLLRNYGVVQQLDLLENYDVIEHLDQLSPAGEKNHESRS